MPKVGPKIEFGAFWPLNVTVKRLCDIDESEGTASYSKKWMRGTRAPVLSVDIADVHE